MLLMKIIDWLFPDTRQRDLDAFITARNPKTTADVEWLTAEYQRRLTRNWL